MEHYVAESAGKIHGKGEAREGGSTRRGVRKIQTKAAAEQAACTQEQANGRRAVSRIRGRVDAQRQRRSLGSGASLVHKGLLNHKGGYEIIRGVMKFRLKIDLE